MTSNEDVQFADNDNGDNKMGLGRKIFEIILGISFPLIFIFGYWNKALENLCGGYSLGGKIVGSIFFVINDKKEYLSVQPFDWYLNLVTLLLTLFFGFIGIVALMYFPIRYWFIPQIRSVANRFKKP